MSQWRCINNCGACCHLKPGDRPKLETYLTPRQLEKYLSMVGKNGWCINFDHQTRTCKIYEDRPDFCRVKPEIFKRMYGVSAQEFNDFAIDCCHQQIEAVYGANSPEMNNYRRMVN